MAERWEYKVESHLNHGQRDGWNPGPPFLDRLGREGWELVAVSIIPREQPSSDPTWPMRWNDETFYFKRKAGEAEG